MSSKKGKAQKIKGLFAFWRYDQFPYVLGGTVDRMSEKGNVNTHEYGYGYNFTPIKLMPEKAGKELLAKLMQLRKEHDAAAKKLHDEFMKKAIELLPELKK